MVFKWFWNKVQRGVEARMERSKIAREKLQSMDAKYRYAILALIAMLVIGLGVSIFSISLKLDAQRLPNIKVWLEVVSIVIISLPFLFTFLYGVQKCCMKRAAVKAKAMKKKSE